MGEPARKLPEEDRPDIPGLRALEGGGEGDGKPKGNLSLVGGKKDDAPEEESPFEFNPADRGSVKKIAAAFGKNRRGLLLGGLGGGGIIALISVMFFMLIPLKIEHMVKNLEKKYLASSQNALENQS